jgi:hypothetical protein
MKLPYLGAHNPMLSQLRQRFVENSPTRYHIPSPTGSAAGGTRFCFRQPAPSTLKGHGWQLQPLQMANAAQTYEAYLTNPDAPVQRDGRCLTDEPYTWADHVQRVEQVEHDHHTHKRFSFTVLSAAQDRCLGCVHLMPLRPFLTRYQVPDHLLSRTGENTAMILYWVCQSHRQPPFSQQLIHALHHWLGQEWELDDHLFRVNPADVSAVQSLQAAGLQVHFCLNRAIMSDSYLFYGG